MQFLSKKAAMALFVMFCGVSQAQTTYDSKTLVDTNSNSTSTSTVNSNNVNNNNNLNVNNTNVDSKSINTNNNNNVSTSTNTNNNINTGDMTNRNINTSTSTSISDNKNLNINNSTSTSDNKNLNINNSTSTSDNKNLNINNSTSTSDNKNLNINNSSSTSTSVNENKNVNVSSSVSDSKQIIDSVNTNTNINKSEITQRVIQPPPTAVAPTMMSGGNSDLCSTGSSGSVQTQIFGVSSGGTVRDLNCERLKLSKTLYDMGMKVAAVATMCQDRRVFDAMMAAGTPCPYEGKIGEQAKAQWESNPEKIPKLDKVEKYETAKNVGIGAILGVLVHKLF
jgi:hypothetical protein